MVDKNLLFFRSLLEHILPKSIENSENQSIFNVSNKRLEVILK